MEHVLSKLPKLNVTLLQGNKISLRTVTVADCNETYVNWLADPLVNRFLETRWSDQTLDAIRKFVMNTSANADNYLFAIIETSTQKHIGNIKLGPTNRHHHYADVSYFIGERAAWGKGYATEAIQLVTQFAFEKLDLHRVQAGVYASNVASAKALEKAGFELEAVFKQQLWSGSEWEDHLWFVKRKGVLSHDIGVGR
jgi:ribosomal-protein-alanine N-acetyltransferase